jgi:hypothetical protein
VATDACANTSSWRHFHLPWSVNAGLGHRSACKAAAPVRRDATYSTESLWEVGFNAKFKPATFYASKPRGVAGSARCELASGLTALESARVVQSLLRFVL